jgi:hypothetical protein
MDALNSFLLFKIYTTNQNQNGKDYAFTDFITGCVQKMPELAHTENKYDNADDELASIPTVIQ